MKFPIVIFFVLVVRGCRAQYEAVLDEESYVNELYRREVNSNPPSQSLDPAIADPSIRLQICEEISRSGVFAQYGKEAVKMEDIYYDLLMQPSYRNIFLRIYSLAESENIYSAFVYDNSYTLLHTEIHETSSPNRVVAAYENEHVFICLLRRRRADEYYSARENLSSPRSSDRENVSEEVSNTRNIPEGNFDVQEAGTELVSASNTETDVDEEDPVTETTEENSNIEETDHGSDFADTPVNFLNNEMSGVERGSDELPGREDFHGEHSEEDDLEVPTWNSFLEMIGSLAEDAHLSEIPSEEEMTIMDADDDSNDLIPFYVSKIYNPHRGLAAHRYVFSNIGFMLAERPANVSSRPDFNVELHYLELRKHHEPVSRCSDDPVCKLNSSSQLSRLCTIALTSSAFKGKITYPIGGIQMTWFNQKVSFRTKEGMAQAAGRSYHELMVCCGVKRIDNGGLDFIFISRAYHPNEVFVYIEGSSGGDLDKTYLENLSTHVSLVHERYNFSDVEI